MIIIIDPGHGGEDSGAIGNNKTLEKDIVLKIAQYLKKLINNTNNIKAFLTRNNDSFVSIKKRIEKAKNLKANLFISIHANSFKDEKVNGTSVFTLSSKYIKNNTLCNTNKNRNIIKKIKNNNHKYLNKCYKKTMSQKTLKKSIFLGSNVLKLIKEINRLHKKTTIEADFAVLKLLQIPSILIETAFISNIKEEKKLTNKKFQKKIAISIFNAIKIYKKLYNFS